jgi:hypothetical protein
MSMHTITWSLANRHIRWQWRGFHLTTLLTRPSRLYYHKLNNSLLLNELFPCITGKLTSMLFTLYPRNQKTAGFPFNTVDSGCCSTRFIFSLPELFEFLRH